MRSEGMAAQAAVAAELKAWKVSLLSHQTAQKPFCRACFCAA